jgi:hypothetical protein
VLHLECRHNDISELIINYEVLIGLVAAVEKGSKAIENGLRDIDDVGSEDEFVSVVLSDHEVEGVVNLIEEVDGRHVWLASQKLCKWLVLTQKSQEA